MKFFQLIPADTNFDFIGKFKVFITFSILSGILVVIGLFTKGLNYGIDFTGGTVMHVTFHPAKNADEVRHLLDGMNEKDATAVALDKENREYLITARTVAEGKGALPLNKRLIQTVGASNVEIKRVDSVGPKVGAELKLAALRSLIYTVILITIYIWLRFDFRFAPGATIAMVHDLLLSTGLYLITGREFTITAIAALLTIAGYSVNDTIVVYDRVREMIKKSGGESMPMPTLINRAINITLSRTLLTSGITLISVVPIIFLTEGEIQSFAMAMCFGIFVGTYSTVYIASPFTIYAQKFLEGRKKTVARTVVA
jgi:preprotein translocase subunit SecF